MIRLFAGSPLTQAITFLITDPENSKKNRAVRRSRPTVSATSISSPHVPRLERLFSVNLLTFGGYSGPAPTKSHVQIGLLP